jgi:hypothetical protein
VLGRYLYVPYSPPPRGGQLHPWLWGAFLGALIGLVWVVESTVRHPLDAAAVLTGIAIAVGVSLASGLLSTLSPWHPE